MHLMRYLVRHLYACPCSRHSASGYIYLLSCLSLPVFYQPECTPRSPELIPVLPSINVEILDSLVKDRSLISPPILYFPGILGLRNLVVSFYYTQRGLFDHCLVYDFHRHSASLASNGVQSGNFYTEGSVHCGNLY